MAKNDYEFKLDTFEFDHKMNLILKSFPNFIENVLKKLGLKLLAKVKKLTPVDTGLLRKSWFLTKPKITSFNAEIEIKNNVKYAAAQEYGFLHKGGKFIQGKFMLKQGINQLNNEVKKIIGTEIQKFLNEIGRVK